MASANDPNTWELKDITSKHVYAHFMFALKEGRFSDNKIKELFLDSSVFLKNKAQDIVRSQQEELDAKVTYIVKINRNRANAARHGPAIRRVLTELIANIEDREKINNEIKDIDILKILLKDEIFLSTSEKCTPSALIFLAKAKSLPIIKRQFFFENLSTLSAPNPIHVMIITASTKASAGLKSSWENELIVIVTHKNIAPINATTGLIDTDPLSSLKSSVIHFLKVIILVLRLSIIVLIASSFSILFFCLWYGWAH
jgi:hypothetical protein